MKKKSIIAILLGMAVAASMAGCAATDPANTSTADPDTTESSGPNISDMSEEKVVETHKLKPVTYGEGETPANAYYKKGNDADGNVCYIVNYEDADGDVYLPLDGTVIYTTDDEEPYMEKVSYSYKLDGELVEEEQNRIYVSTAVADGNTSNDSGAAESEQPAE